MVIPSTRDVIDARLVVAHESNERFLTFRLRFSFGSVMLALLSSYPASPVLFPMPFPEAASARIAPIIADVPGHLAPRYRIRPAARPAGYCAGDEPVPWTSGTFIEAPYCDGWWIGYVIAINTDAEDLSRAALDDGGGVGDGKVQIAFPKAPVGEGGYGFYRDEELRRAIEWDEHEWLDYTSEERFPPVS